MGDVLSGEIINLFPNLIRSKQIIKADRFFQKICRRSLFDKLEFIRLYQKTPCFY